MVCLCPEQEPRIGRRASTRLVLTAAVLALAACAPAAPSGSAQAPQVTARPKTLTIGVATQTQAMGVFSGQSVGGWTSLNELHSAGLITSDYSTPRPIGRLAEKVPSVDDGSIVLLPDGRMRVVYSLRHDVTWQDGAPFTAHDVAFSHTFLVDQGLPVTLRDTVQYVDAVEAVDDYTAAFLFRRPYYLGNALGVREFWPQPRHLLQDAYRRATATANADEVMHLAYWTSEYVNLGPFRLVSFDPGEGSVYEAYAGYFLGRPRLDTVRVRSFSDQNTLYANLLAGTVDLLADTGLNTELGAQLKERWESSGQGTVHVRAGATYFLSPQWRPGVQREPANLDVRIRQALYQAIDREAMSDLVQPAWSILPPGDRLYDATRDGLRRYPYDPERSKVLLRDLGWASAPDGLLRNASDGRRFSNTISTVATGRLWEVAAYADSWRRIGIEVEEQQVPPAQARNLEYRAQFPSWEATSAGQGDSMFSRLEGPAASAQNRWSGNRGGYEDPVAQQLLARYFAGLTDRDQAQAMRDVAEFIAAELPLLIFYFNTDHLGVRAGVRALDDVTGGQHSSRPFGTYTRNAHLWDSA
jgi:peptide/nickel transport system substrate-binding protein